MVEDEVRWKVRRSCTRWLSGHGEATMRESLTALADMPEAEGYPDFYGVGNPVHQLEFRVAKLLDKPSARFVVKGVIAQQAALRAWCDASAVHTVALHPRSHLVLDELGAFEQLQPLRGVRLGKNRPFDVTELESVGEPLGAVVVELPLRRAAYSLPSWDELVAISQWCHERDVPLHIDGARLWEAAPSYDRPVSDLAALADSVYVSFYKGLGGLAGAALLGTRDFLARATPWLIRHGANVHTVYPFALSALAGLESKLPRMPEYHARARTLAEALGELPGITVAGPQTSGFAVYLRADRDELEAAHLRLAERTGTWLFNGFVATEVPGVTMVEIQVGEATAAIEDAEAAQLVRTLLDDVTID